MADTKTVIEQAYAAFNERDVTFRPLRGRGCTVEAVLIWRTIAPEPCGRASLLFFVPIKPK